MTTTATLLTAGPLKVNPATREAFAYGAKLLLTDGEFDLLRVLIDEPERPWTRAELLDAVPYARERGAGWLMHRAAHLTAQLLRVGVRAVLGGSTTDEIRLFEPAEMI